MTREDLIFDSYLDPPEPEEEILLREERWYVLEDMLYDEAREDRLWQR